MRFAQQKHGTKHHVFVSAMLISHSFVLAEIYIFCWYPQNINSLSQLSGGFKVLNHQLDGHVAPILGSGQPFFFKSFLDDQIPILEYF